MRTKTHCAVLCTYMEYAFAGELTGAVQVWVKDPVTGKPVEKTKKIVSSSYLCFSKIRCAFANAVSLRKLELLWRPELVAEKREQGREEDTM